MELLSLPLEMMEEIFLYLAPKDIISLSLTCKKLRGLTDSDQLWVQACKNEFGVCISSSSNGFAQRFYKSVLRRYGRLLGLWMKKSYIYKRSEESVGQLIKDYYGGLLQITYSNGQIICNDLLPPKEPHLKEPLRPIKLFTISLDEANKDKAVIKCYCSIAPLDHNTCELSLSDEVLTMKCSSSQSDIGEVELNSYFQEKCFPWIDNQVDLTNDEAYQRTGNHFLKKCRTLVGCAVINTEGNSYSKLDFPRAITDFLVPIQPGLFKGTSSKCGIQLIVLNYVNRRTVRASKITGDHNTPSGVLSFVANLGTVMDMNEEDQASMDMLEQMTLDD